MILPLYTLPIISAHCATHMPTFLGWRTWPSGLILPNVAWLQPSFCHTLPPLLPIPTITVPYPSFWPDMHISNCYPAAPSTCIHWAQRSIPATIPHPTAGCRHHTLPYLTGPPTHSHTSRSFRVPHCHHLHAPPVRAYKTLRLLTHGGDAAQISPMPTHADAGQEPAGQPEHRAARATVAGTHVCRSWRWRDMAAARRACKRQHNGDIVTPIRLPSVRPGEPEKIYEQAWTATSLSQTKPLRLTTSELVPPSAG